MSVRRRPLKSRLSAKLGFGLALTGVSATLFAGLFGAVAVTPADAASTAISATYTLLPAADGGPQSLTGCSGTLARDPQGDNWYDYTFSCAPQLPGSEATGNIIAYSIDATRQNIDGIDFDQANVLGNGSPAVYANGLALLNETVTCNTDAPSDGFDCNSGLVVGTTTAATAPTVNDPCTAPTAGATYTNLGCIPNGDSVQGQIQLSKPYCAYIPKGAKAGTPRVPTAIVDLAVTDDSGAQDGPFELTPSFKCAKVAAVAPTPKKKKPTKSKKVAKTVKK